MYLHSINNIENTVKTVGKGPETTVTKYLADLQDIKVLPTFSSKQSMITEGYFFVSHRKNAGTPILKSTKV